MKKLIVSTVLVFVVTIMMIACGSAPQTGKIERGPEFTRGSKYWPSGKICASAGWAATPETITRDEARAVARARDELARQMGTVVNNIAKDYAREITARGGRADESVTIDKSIQDVKNLMVAGSEMYDSDTTATEIWVLVCINQEKFYDAIRKSESLSKELQEEIVSRAKEEWDELLKNRK